MAENDRRRRGTSALRDVWSSVLGDRVELPADLESVGASRESPPPHSEELPPRVPVRRERRYDQLRKQGAVDFYGSTDPAEAEGWLKRTERVLDQMDCDPEERFDYAVSLHISGGRLSRAVPPGLVH
ncbi:hypothetical protein K2173_018848 [Erythroxylum novogranatense]|uniref:Uncharacterized protein n=1 Tax=Erythroxylum novogranatense TaxID=1862640 RepID=A0AAV8SBE4_9ROSI|nr:hypothetical protein K2173_018848 [Erythroxylum novogranatense]